MSIDSQRQRGNNMPSNIAWTYDSAKFAVANFDEGVNIYSTENSQIIHELNGQHTTDVSCIAFSPNGQNILSGDKWFVDNLGRRKWATSEENQFLFTKLLVVDLIHKIKSLQYQQKKVMYLHTSSEVICNRYN